MLHSMMHKLQPLALTIIDKICVHWACYIINAQLAEVSYTLLHCYQLFLLTIPRLLSFSYIYVVNMLLLVMPSTLCCDWSLGSVPLVTDVMDVRNSWSLGLYLGLVLVILHVLKSKEDRKEVGAGVALMVLPFLPASGALFQVGFVVAER